MDRQRIDAFLDRFVGYAAGATTIGLLAVADRSGLLHWLGQNRSGTAESIATGAGLDKRYVEEILSGLTAAGTLEYDPDTEVFTLPAEHALFLADPSSPYYMGGWLDMIPAALKQVDGVARATEHGGGVAFEEFGPEMIRGIDRGNAPSQRIFLTKRWLSAVPGLVEHLQAGIRVADVGCGTGTAAIEMADAFPASTVTGFDVSPQALEIARKRGETLPNLSFEQQPVTELPLEPGFHLITAFDVIHDLPDPLSGLSRIRQALTRDGQFLMMEPNASSHLEENLHQRGALLYGISALHCMTQSLARGGEGLGAAWGSERAEDYARRAGFSSLQNLEEIDNKFSSFYLLVP